MSAGRNAIPLIGLEAVVLDTETTGLDPRNARIVEVAVIRVDGEQLSSKPPFRRLVRPGIGIPAVAVRIHGIDESMLVDAPDFPALWPELAGYLGDSTIIGHAISFDMALLKHELDRIEARWSFPETLDTRLLAQIADRALAGCSLEELGARLNIEIKDRHSALGDATATAKIYCALIPKLRDRGIRTFGEASRACRALIDAGGASPYGREHPDAIANKTVRDAAVQGFDTYPYRQRVSVLMTTPARSVAGDTPIASALSQMQKDNISSLFVFSGRADATANPKQTGIITERDVLRALDAHGAAALALPVSQVMSRPLSAVPADALAYRAIGRMHRLGFRHLGVTDDAGKVIGALSARDLLRLRAEAGVELGDEIAEATDTTQLARAWGKLPSACADLVREGMLASEIATVISQQVQLLTHRAAALAESRMIQSGRDAPPCPYALAVLGSAGRGESLLAMDQDNALVFSDDAPSGADCWFQLMAAHLADILHIVGVPYCAGGVMAKNAQWRGSLNAWRQRVREWIERSSPADLLSVDIFFDMYGVYGETALADMLWREALDAAKGNAGFSKLLVEAAGSVDPGRNWFGGIRTDDGRINLKRTGLFGLVSAARSLAIYHHVLERSTVARLVALEALLPNAARDIELLIEAHDVFLDLILKQQLIDIESGRPASNAVEVKRLSRRERDRLRAALQTVEHLNETERDLLFRF